MGHRWQGPEVAFSLAKAETRNTVGSTTRKPFGNFNSEQEVARRRKWSVLLGP